VDAVESGKQALQHVGTGKERDFGLVVATCDGSNFVMDRGIPGIADSHLEVVEIAGKTGAVPSCHSVASQKIVLEVEAPVVLGGLADKSVALKGDSRINLLGSVD
jgi:hypothetical protein